MPNAFAYIVLFSWPLVVFVLFRTLPLQMALIWSILAGYLLLPTGTGINLPMVPVIDKTLIPSLSAAVMCLVVARRQALDTALGRSAVVPAPALRRPEKTLLAGFVLLVLGTPVITVLQNADPVIAGPTFIPGLRPYDALSITASAAITLLPFLLAQRFLATAQAHRLVLLVLVVAMLAYSLLVLFEVRMSRSLTAGYMASSRIPSRSISVATDFGQWCF